MRLLEPPHRGRRRGLLAAAAALLPKAWAQSRFPERAITLIVPFAPGGIADLTARAVAEQMTRSLGQPVVVENRPGAQTAVGTEYVVRAVPDGNTLLVVGSVTTSNPAKPMARRSLASGGIWQ